MISNATLTEVHGPGTPDRSGKRTDEGTLLWSGMLRCYIKRASKTLTVNGNYTKIEFDQLIINGRVPVSIDIGSELRGATLTIDDQRDGSITRKFRAVGIEKLAVGSIADSVRIELADERS